jgi:AcrR family transcriptional regulator
MTQGQSLRERRKQETREQIKRAARTLMVEVGYDKVTMRALAAAAGVGLGTIGLHFKDKKTLLLSAFHDEIGQESLRAFEAMPQEGSLKEKLMSILGGLYAYYGRNALFLRPVVREALFATGEWRERFDAQLGEMIHLITGLVDRHKALGEVRQGVSGHHVAMAGWSLYLNGLIDGLNGETFDVEAQLAKVEPLLDVLLNGVLTQGDGHA